MILFGASGCFSALWIFGGIALHDIVATVGEYYADLSNFPWHTFIYEDIVVNLALESVCVLRLNVWIK